MGRRKKKPEPFFRNHDGWWYVQLGKEQIKLARGQDNEDAAWRAYYRVMAQRGPAAPSWHGGDERRGPAEPFRALYSYAAENGLQRTAHAGETTESESIWAALNIGAERLGHVLSAPQDPELMEVLAQRQIPVEVCLSSNVRTGCLKDLQQHPVRRMFDAGLLVTLNTDDPAMFHTSLIQEYALAQDLFGFSDEHLRELVRNSWEASFLSTDKKVRMLQQFDREVDQLARLA